MKKIIFAALMIFIQKQAQASWQDGWEDPRRPPNEVSFLRQEQQSTSATIVYTANPYQNPVIGRPVMDSEEQRIIVLYTQPHDIPVILNQPQQRPYIPSISEQRCCQVTKTILATFALSFSMALSYYLIRLET